MCFVKKVFLEISQNSQENTCVRVSFLIKLQTQACNFIKKETLLQVFSCEFCEICKNNFFYRTHLVAASEIYVKLTDRLQRFILVLNKNHFYERNLEKRINYS